MNRRQFLRAMPVTAPLVATRPAQAQQTASAAPSGAGADGWIPLFNGRNLDGWYTFLQRSGRDAAEKSGYVSVENGLLHIMGRDVPNSDVESGYLATNAEFENVRSASSTSGGSNASRRGSRTSATTVSSTTSSARIASGRAVSSARFRKPTPVTSSSWAARAG